MYEDPDQVKRNNQRAIHAGISCVVFGVLGWLTGSGEIYMWFWAGGVSVYFLMSAPVDRLINELEALKDELETIRKK